MTYLRGIFYSLPFQLLFLHFRKYQVLLLFWALLFLVVSGNLMKTFGAEALFLAPEYLGNVNALSTAITGMAVAVFIMCWNITTFILFSRHFSFLAATQFPFLKYCINNSVIPVAFLLFFLTNGYLYAHNRELISNIEILFLTLGFISGLLFIFSFSFFYFFRADKTIFKNLQPFFNNAKNYLSHLQPEHLRENSALIQSEWYLDSLLRVRRCRDVSHYAPKLIETIFKRHHFAAVLCIIIAYLFLIGIGFFLDYKAFQIPAAASIVLFFSILIGISGAFAYFFQSWSIPALIAFLLLLNMAYEAEWIDPRNKAYGLTYSKKADRPQYSEAALTQLSNNNNVAADLQNMESILARWKSKQNGAKPMMVVVATSGGGTRSATFTMNILQRLDSLTSGAFFKQTALITGASGGMIGAAYFRELYRQRLTQPSLHLQSGQYIDAIAGDLLNPTFSSFVARDLFAPQQHFTINGNSYLKDRGFAFERTLNDNTHGVLNKALGDYKNEEENAVIPLMFFHNVITRDGKKLIISTQPVRFMMRSAGDSTHTTLPDAVDFQSFFSAQTPQQLRLLTALRMNATFPVVLPNVWLPTEPVIDVMDGGLRDNYGVETAYRFLAAMRPWIEENTGGVILVQIRDRMDGGWENPYTAESLTENAVKPFFLLQHNWYKMMEYSQADMAAYFMGGSRLPVHRLVFQYTPRKEDSKAALNFHLTKEEKVDIAASLQSTTNSTNFSKLLQVLGTTVPGAKSTQK